MPILMFDKDENFSVLRLEDVSWPLFFLPFVINLRLFDVLRS